MNCATLCDPGPRPGGQRRIVAYVVTHPMTVEVLLRGQLAFLVREGFEVHVLCGPGGALDRAGEATSYRAIGRLRREIRLVSDLWALLEIFVVLRRLRPDIVNASTPKAGLLGMVGGLLARVPHRVYTLRGLRLETARGLKKRVLVIAEKIAVACAHRVVAVSDSLRIRTVATGIAAAEKVEVLGLGSSNGVDTDRFRSGLSRTELELRQSLGLADGTPVIGFVGRLTRDKGIHDLMAAFNQQVLPRVPSACLLVVGGYEDGDPIEETLKRNLEQNPAVVMTGMVADPAPYYRLMNVLALPSYREGFPNAPLEAAASEIPVVAYKATGTIDAVVDGITGVLVPVGAIAPLGEALCSYLLDSELRNRHGQAGRARVVEYFRPDLVWLQWKDFYLRQLRS